MTQTQEEAVLLSALEDDRYEVMEKLMRFLPGERRSLESACLLIMRTILSLEEEEAAQTPAPD